MKQTAIRIQAGGEFLSVRGVSADVTVDGPIARARIVVTFNNDLGRTLEGDLVFPLPPKAALRELVVKIGQRTINGKIRARERARATYERAIAAGQSAALGESEGEDLARLRVAPIESGEDVEIALSVDQLLLPIADGHRLIVPLTYMPRYVEAGAKLTETEVAALKRERPLTLAARANVHIAISHPAGKPWGIRCVSHPTATKSGERSTEIEVKDAPLDRDLQVEIADRPKGEKPALWVRHDAGEGPDGYGPTTAVAIVPPAFADEGPTIARSVTFLVDRSGSMGGAPMASAIRAVRGALRALGPEDRFNIIAFDNVLECLAEAPVPFDDASLGLADQFISQIDARGGTDAWKAISAALNAQVPNGTAALMRAPKPDQTYRLRLVVFMTDGDVASAALLFKGARERLVDTRVHVLGIGDSVQHSMLSELAQLGGGTYTPVSTNEDLERGLARLKNAMTAPLWTGIRVLVEKNGERRAPQMLEPPGPIDLFASEPALFAFRGAITSDERLLLVGQRLDGEDETIAADLSIPRGPPAEGAATIWALLRNQRLTYRFDQEDDATLEGLGTAFGVVNRKVALVGVHAENRDATIEGSVAVSLPMPRNIADEGSFAVGGMAKGGPPTFGAPPPPPMSAGFGYAPPPPSPGFGPPPPAPAMGAPPPPLPGSPMRSQAQPPPMQAARPAAPVPQSRSAPSPVAAAPPPPPPARMAPPAMAAPPAPAVNAPAKPAMSSLTNDEAGLRSLFLHQKADGFFASDAPATLAAVAALVSRGHTAREGLFRAELRRTTIALRGKLANVSGEERLFVLLALALLTMPHGDDAPEGLPGEMAQKLSGISLGDLAGARAKVGEALALLPAEWARGALAGEVRRVFL